MNRIRLPWKFVVILIAIPVYGRCTADADAPTFLAFPVSVVTFAARTFEISGVFVGISVAVIVYTVADLRRWRCRYAALRVPTPVAAAAIRPAARSVRRAWQLAGLSDTPTRAALKLYVFIDLPVAIVILTVAQLNFGGAVVTTFDAKSIETADVGSFGTQIDVIPIARVAHLHGHDLPVDLGRESLVDRSVAIVILTVAELFCGHAVFVYLRVYRCLCVFQDASAIWGALAVEWLVTACIKRVPTLAARVESTICGALVLTGLTTGTDQCGSHDPLS